MHGLVMCDASQIFKELIYFYDLLSVLFSQSIQEILSVVYKYKRAQVMMNPTKMDLGPTKTLKKKSILPNKVTVPPDCLALDSFPN